MKFLSFRLVIVCGLLATLVFCEEAKKEGEKKKKRPDEPDISTNEEHFDEDGHHDDDFDHEAVTGSHQEAEAFKELEPEESKRRLGVLVDKMDTSKDGHVDKEELKNWIIQSFKNLDVENARHRMDENDENKDHKVTWAEFMHHSYGYKESEVAEMVKDKTEEMKSFLQTVMEEKSKFDLADVNKDGSLDLQEYTAFEHPQNYPHMTPYEIHKTLQDFDKNNDSFVDEKEFIGGDGLDPKMAESERKHFHDYDKNKDGKLDKEEMIPWVMPGVEGTAIQEVEHLFNETDTNKDNNLSKDEILAQHELWVGSHATDYGKHLDDMKKEEL